MHIVYDVPRAPTSELASGLRRRARIVAAAAAVAVRLVGVVAVQKTHDLVVMQDEFFARRQLSLAIETGKTSQMIGVRLRSSYPIVRRYGAATGRALGAEKP